MMDCGQTTHSIMQGRFFNLHYDFLHIFLVRKISPMNNCSDTEFGGGKLDSSLRIFFCEFKKHKLLSIGYKPVIEIVLPSHCPLLFFFQP